MDSYLLGAADSVLFEFVMIFCNNGFDTETRCVEQRLYVVYD